MIERKLNHDRQILHREQSHFQFRTQQETMIEQLVNDKKELTQRVKQLADTLAETQGSLSANWLLLLLVVVVLLLLLVVVVLFASHGAILSPHKRTEADLVLPLPGAHARLKAQLARVAYNLRATNNEYKSSIQQREQQVHSRLGLVAVGP